MFSPQTILQKQGLQTLGDFDGHVLIVDRHRCRFCKVLMEEIARATPLSSSPIPISTIDLGRLNPAEWEPDHTWVPGVPCFVSKGQVYLGVDAFKKVREMVRSVQGISIQES